MLDPVLQEPPSPSFGVTTLLIRRVQEGSREARGHLYQHLDEPLLKRIRHHPLFKGVVSRYATEEDILAEAVLCCERAQRLEREVVPHGKDVRRLLNTVVNGVIVDRLRHESAAKRGGGWHLLTPENMIDGFEYLPSSRLGAPRPQTPTSEVRVRDLLEKASTILSEREYKAFTALHLDGHSSDDAALQMKTTAAAVRSLALRARRKLASALADDLERDQGIAA